MKKILHLLLLLPVLAFGQNPEQNYIRTYTYKDSTTTSNPAKALATVTYIDGLGRPIQQVAGKMTPDGKDIITHIEYDGFGRQAKDYLPYPAETSNLAFDTSAHDNTISYYTTAYGDASPFSEKIFEASPLNRVLKQGAPGTTWQPAATGNDHTVKIAYQTNGEAEVKKLKADAVWDPVQKLYEITFVNQGEYAAAQLYKTITKDENWTSGNNNTTEEFKNTDGQVVLKVAYNEGVPHRIYYVYDQFGNLTYVIPPLAADELGGNGSVITAEVMDNLCYAYKYDYRNRLSEKHIPGAGWVHMVYDKLDRVVLTQDQLHRGNTWLFTKYDPLGRTTYTGEYANTESRVAIQSGFDSGTTPTLSESKSTTTFTQNGTPVYYTSQAYPMSGYSLLTINYYDNYDFDLPAPLTIPLENIYHIPLATTATPTTLKGLATCSKVRVLDTDLWITTVTGYDTKGRVVWTKNRNPFLNHELRVDTKIDFLGRPTDSRTLLNNYNITDMPVFDYFTYDAAGRMLTHRHKAKNGADLELLAYNSYDSLGQLIEKKVGGTKGTSYDATQGLQKVNYSYNIRGWLTGINDIENFGGNSINFPDLFSFKIAYNNITDCTDGTLPANNLYNGNISETWWRTAKDNVLRKYSYNYDNLNRLTDAYYQKPEDCVPLAGNYNESMGYDKNGNIMSMERAGGTDEGIVIGIDDLTYSYSAKSNRLKMVTDTTQSPQGFDNGASGISTDYSYDLNGNMTYDRNKGITEITYNYLNLPKKISFGTSRYIEYVYDATGKKLQKKVSDNGINTITKYKESFQYTNDTLQFFPTAEGYVKWNDGDYKYIYQYKDHLGNVRVSYAANVRNGANTLRIVEEDNYYPFGLKHTGYNNDQDLLSSAAAQNYKYNGKELQDELGLNMYDYGARNYDPALGRWVNIDKKAEKYPAWSPYTFALDNPVRYIDPDGNDVQDPIKEIVDKGMQSQTFKTLYTKAGVNNSNYNGIIKMGKTISNTDANGNITINSKVSGERAVLDLTHELTNRANIGELNALSDKVANGEINTEDYAYGIVAIESEALVNQFVVAKELGINFGKGASGMNTVLEKFASGEITLNELETVIYSNMSSNQVGNQSAIEVYKKQGSELRQEKQKLDEKSKNKKQDEKE